MNAKHVVKVNQFRFVRCEVYTLHLLIFFCICRCFIGTIWLWFTMEVNLKQFWTDKRKLFLLSVIHLKFTKQTKYKYLKTRVAYIPPSLPKNIWDKKKVNRLFNIFQTSKIVYCRPSNLATYFLTSRMCQLIWSHTEKNTSQLLVPYLDTTFRILAYT